MSTYPKVISLDGDWQFAYSRYQPDIGKALPAEEVYEALMPVPGYWDDHIERLEQTLFWSRGVRFNPEYRRITFPMGSGKPADASLPYILGTGWYKKQLHADADWRDSTVTLTVGGVTLEAWVWLNDQFVGHHVGHLTPFELRLDPWIKPGETNELVIAVSNQRTDRIGCSIRGFKGRSAGIYRSVQLKVAGSTRIKDVYLYPDRQLKQLTWNVELDGRQPDGEYMLDWRVYELRTGKLQAANSQALRTGCNQWTTDTLGMKPWSDHRPHLYRIELQLRQGSQVIDQHEQLFGLRSLVVDGIKLRLNGKPVILRGLTEHAYFPETCTPPTDIEYYRTAIRKLKQLGFNWIRFHTWSPPDECLQAADELGMMLQVETPNGFLEQDWLDLLLACRKHPSVVLYCCGNEVSLDKQMIKFVERMAEHTRDLVPDALFSPMEALRGIESRIGDDEEDAGFVNDPVPHHPEKLARVRAFTDVFEPHGAMFSYRSLEATEQSMHDKLSIFGRPCLIHELGINDTYLNLDLEHRYKGTRIGTEMYAAVRSYIEKMGLIDKAPLYYQNSCRWMHQIVKYSIENARSCEYVSGYDLLGAVDCHWHRTGYAIGLMNEFYELKPGITPDEVLNYNGESVLLAGCGKFRNLASGQKLVLTLSASLYGDSDLEEGLLSWMLIDDERAVYDHGIQTVRQIPHGRVVRLGELAIELPRVEAPRKLELVVSLTGGEYHLKNRWDYWIFPESEDHLGDIDLSDIRVLTSLDADSLAFVSCGGKALLIGTGPFPYIPTSFQIMSGGRTQGSNATVIRDHPLMMNFPHEGFCDWQFYPMLHGGRTVVFNALDIPFDPIVEVVSGYKIIRKQSSLFELRVGAGHLLVCTLRLPQDDPGARYLYRLMLQYMKSPAFQPATAIEPAVLEEILRRSGKLEIDFSTDEGYDSGGHVQKSKMSNEA